jgi:hypothetical protein
MSASQASQPSIFDQILRLEDTARAEFALATMGSDGATRARNEKNLRNTNAQLFALIDGLTMDQAREYNEFRKAARA